MNRVLVCGGRDYHDVKFLNAALRDLYVEYGGFTVVIHGAAHGADSLARDWAKGRNIPHLPFPAEWDRLGKAAGMARNRQMLIEGKPDLVVAFPGGHGTMDMVRQSRAAGVPVIEIRKGVPV